MSLPVTTEARGLGSRWMSLCFGACMYASRGQKELSEKFEQAAAMEIEELLEKRDRGILLILNFILTILHSHDQDVIAASIVRASSLVAERMLPAEDPIRITAAWMVAVAGCQLKQNSPEGGWIKLLSQVCEDIEAEFGWKDEAAIAARYNYAWMLNHEGRSAEAEEVLVRLYEISCHVLRPIHMQSVSIVATLSRAQEPQKKYDLAIRNMRTAIADCEGTLDCDHPWRLESKRFLAVLYLKDEIDQPDLAIDLYREVLRGRVKMLGRDHRFTRASRQDLENMLRCVGQLDETTEWEIEELFDKASPILDNIEAF
jgi:tetratricopeptide (TPR) repeat protein